MVKPKQVQSKLHMTKDFNNQFYIADASGTCATAGPRVCCVQQNFDGLVAVLRLVRGCL
jgi:hypothetical protein